jgi:hypothetical protein
MTKFGLEELVWDMTVQVTDVSEEHIVSGWNSKPSNQ